MFLGYYPLDEAFKIRHLFKSAADVPTASSTAPFFRVYGLDGLVETGSLTADETGAITNATNATPIVITSAAHGLTTGQRVTIANVGGNTDANGTWTITVVDPNTFSLDGSVGNAAYTAGGTWTTTGLYGDTITPTAAGGYAAGEHYDVVVYGTVTNVVAAQYRFGVS